MKCNRIVYEPYAELCFTPGEIKLLLELSEQHYDHKCKAAGQIGGTLYGLNVRADHRKKVTAVLSFRDIDLLAKITEVASYARSAEGVALNIALHRVLISLNEKSAEVNGRSE